MALQIISVVLFTVFFSEALTLMCYNCSTNSLTPTCTQTANCSSSSQCSSMTKYDVVSHLNVKSCAAASCVNWSINVGWFSVSSKCCSSDYCNNATDSDPENGLSCYACENCTNTLKCKGSENQCFTAEVGLNNQTYTVKGCATQNICNNSAIVNSTLPLHLIIFSFSCLEANNTQNMTQGPVSASTSTFPTFFHLKSVLGGFLLVLLVFGCTVLPM